MESNFDYKNEFGEGILYREGNPIQLLKYVEDDENHNEYGEMINEETLDIIREIDGLVAKRCLYNFDKDTFEKQIIVLMSNYEFLMWKLPSSDSDIKFKPLSNMNPFQLFKQH